MERVDAVKTLAEVKLVINELKRQTVELGMYIASLDQKEIKMNTDSNVNEFGVKLPAPYDCYSVTENGRVFSHKFNKIEEMTPVNNSTPYLNVNVSVSGKKHFKPIHVLVALAFHGPRPNKLVIRHLDGNHLNNHKDNLKYGTQAENAQDAVRHGTVRSGSKHPFAKLTEVDVQEIMVLRDRGFTYKEISGMFDVQLQTVWRAVNDPNAWKSAKNK